MKAKKKKRFQSLKRAAKIIRKYLGFPKNSSARRAGQTP